MYGGKTLFAQVMSFLPWKTFSRIVARYQGDRLVRRLRCSEHYRAMAFAQLTGRESLRDLEACLAACPSKLYHSGFRTAVRRSTLADANARRDWRLFAAFAQRLIVQARALYVHEPLAAALHETAYALDSTTVDLCLSLFPWARFRKTKAAVKMHTLPVGLTRLHPQLHAPLRGQTPRRQRARFAAPGSGRDLHHGPRLCRLWAPLPATPSRRLFRHPRQEKLPCRRLYSAPTERTLGVIADQTIALDGLRTKNLYPDRLRRIRYKDPQANKTLVLLTNRSELDALTICSLYKSRWQVELFFKWLKQHLRVKRFLGVSENAVKSQLWIAVSVYVLVAILRKRLAIDTPLSTMLQILSVMPFEQMPLYQALTAEEYNSQPTPPTKQLNLLDL